MGTNTERMTPSDILKRPYARILTPYPESGIYTAEILEFHGCIADGSTPEEAYANLESVAESWIEAAQDAGQEIPEPLAGQGYAGKVALRLPRSLHRRAVEMAERDGTSLNQFLVSAIAERVGAASLFAHLLERLAQPLAVEGTVLNVVRWAVSSTRQRGILTAPVEAVTNTAASCSYPLKAITSQLIEGGRQRG